MSAENGDRRSGDHSTTVQCSCIMHDMSISAPKTKQEQLTLLKWSLLVFAIIIGLVFVAMAFGIEDDTLRDYALILVGTIAGVVFVILILLLVRLVYLVHSESPVGDEERIADTQNHSEGSNRNTAFDYRNTTSNPSESPPPKYEDIICFPLPSDSSTMAFTSSIDFGYPEAPPAYQESPPPPPPPPPSTGL
ncbi:hypothetical protein CAPTEDRAFT_216029 [Capitella teleta]|uniref:Uncharacterized protein n=1 Tax=Capitella teleta TaxID=283909 RepID=R7TRG0_CAPTE|nr:hypothetical protein CAPTEDRAFT_216029 [Capitella teleta]|eukprot:ELT96498.1 hypothetical protein CAPTEDRAFT_216029 [Capitella teleta]